MSAPYLLDGFDQKMNFPPVELACREPNGLLAIGGDLSLARLLSAYRQGVFPWYNEDQPILWWSPDPRAVLFPGKLKISRSLKKVLKSDEFTVTMDTCFPDVINACAQPRPQQSGTWILPEMAQAYRELHKAGYAHSVETWHQDQLVGGLYGVCLGGVFCGESMFTTRSNASKVAFVGLVAELLNRDVVVIDCQMDSAHLRSLGSDLIPRSQFVEILDQYCDLESNRGKWSCCSSTVSLLNRVKNTN